MKLTTEQIRQIIKEELNEVTKGKYSKNYRIQAPGPVYDDEMGRNYTPIETGSSIVYDTPEYDDPKIRDFAKLDPEMAKELHRSVIGREDLEDFDYVSHSIEAGSGERALADLYKHAANLRRAARKARREGREEDLEKIGAEIATVEAAIEKLDRRSKDPYGDTRRDRPKGFKNIKIQQ